MVLTENKSYSDFSLLLKRTLSIQIGKNHQSIGQKGN